MSSIGQHHAEIRPSRVAGEGLFATKDIPAGELIAEVATPLFAVLNIASESAACGYCFESRSLLKEPHSNRELNNCAACQRIKYCSKNCQRRSWKRVHKFECKIYNVKQWPPLPSQVRLALQVALMKNNGTLTDEELVSIDRMARSKTGRKDVLLTEKQAAYDLIRHDEKSRATTYQDIESLFDLITANTMGLTSVMLEQTGVVLDPFLSKANHSCQPNASIVFDGRRASIRSLEFIAKGEEITQSYIDFTFHRTIRKSKLKDVYDFDGVCPDCTSNDPFDSAPLSPLMQDLYNAHTRAHMNPDMAVKISKAMIRTAQENDLPLTRQPITDACEILLNSSLRDDDLKNALIILVKLYLLIDPVLYPQPFFVTPVAHTLILLIIIERLSEQDHNKDEDGWLRDWGIEWILPVMRRITQDLITNSLKSRGPSPLYDWATKLEAEFEEALKIPIFRKPVPVDKAWRQFNRLKDRVIDLSGAAGSIYSDS